MKMRTKIFITSAVCLLIFLCVHLWAADLSFSTRPQDNDNSMILAQRLAANLHMVSIAKPLNAVSIASETTVWTPAAGKKFRITGYHLVASVAGNITLKDNTSGTTIMVIPSAAGGSGTFGFFPPGLLSAAANNVLTATGPATATLSGTIFGTEE